MSFLSRFRILTKVLAVIGLLSAITLGITVLSINALKQISDQTALVARSSDEAILASRMNANVLAIGGAEARIAADPRPESWSAARAEIEKEVATFKQRLEQIGRLVQSAENKARLGELEKEWINYNQELENVYRAAEAVQNFQMTDELDRVRSAVTASHKTAEDMRTKARTLIDELDKRVNAVTQQAEEEYARISMLTMVAAAIGIALGLLFGFLIGQYGVAKPIRVLVDMLKKLANGDYSVEVTGADRKDEVGEVAQAAVVFKENGLEKIRLQQQQEAERKQRAEQRRADMHKLADDFETAVGRIIDTVSSASTELEAAAGTLTNTAEMTQQLSGTVAAASEQASANVQTVAAASDEMANSVLEISRQVQESSRIAGDAVKQSEQTDVRITRLSQAAGRIGDVVKLITAIAEQTNLLALNATIEAARAGEAGRGFAVVAQEVKELAAQTAKATSEIGAQVAEIQTTTHDSVTAIKDVGAIINRISDIAAGIAAAVEEQGAATQEIARNIQQAAQGTTQVATNITNVNKGAGETGSASVQVLASAQSLAAESNHLKAEVHKFLDTVRAA